MKDLFSLRGKIALITGGSVGIGAMIAEGFVSFGAKVYIVSRSEQKLDRKQKELASIGACEYLVADVSSIAGIESLAAQYAEREQSLDILINNAGISDGRTEIEDIKEHKWDAVMDPQYQGDLLHDPEFSAVSARRSYPGHAQEGDQYRFY